MHVQHVYLACGRDPIGAVYYHERMPCRFVYGYRARFPGNRDTMQYPAGHGVKKANVCRACMITAGDNDAVGPCINADSDNSSDDTQPPQ